jgi:hypothetical protein
MSSPPLAILAELKEAIADHERQLESLSCRQISSQPLGIIAELEESIANHERQLEALDCRISTLEPNLTKAQADLKELKSSSPAPVSTPTPVPPVSPSKSPKEVEFPLQEAKSVDGIISYLTRKHGGNVQDKGIVIITSQSGYSGEPGVALRNLADLTSDSYFNSRNEPGQWVCWDFRQRRVRLTHYTVRCEYLRSWVLESSLDGMIWTQIDRKKNNEFEGKGTASYAVLKSIECRFIRLTQTAQNHDGEDYLAIWAFEFFGTLIESRP